MSRRPGDAHPCPPLGGSARSGRPVARLGEDLNSQWHAIFASREKRQRHRTEILPSWRRRTSSWCGRSTGIGRGVTSARSSGHINLARSVTVSARTTRLSSRDNIERSIDPNMCGQSSIRFPSPRSDPLPPSRSHPSPWKPFGLCGPKLAAKWPALRRLRTLARLPAVVRRRESNPRNVSAVAMSSSSREVSHL
jgi:hypothetical protein